MQYLHPLDPKERRTDGKAPNVPVCPGQTVDVLWTRAQLPKAQTGDTRNGYRKSNLACAVIRRTASDWGVM